MHVPIPCFTSVSSLSLQKVFSVFSPLLYHRDLDLKIAPFVWYSIAFEQSISDINVSGLLLQGFDCFLYYFVYEIVFSYLFVKLRSMMSL